MKESEASLLSDWVEAVLPGLNRRKKLQAAWGHVGDKDGWLASRSFDLTRTDSNADWMDDKTWSDLEFPRIFSTLNTTITPLGDQYLYKQLRKYEYSADAMTRRYETYETLRTDQALREEIQLALAALDTDSAARIADVLLGPPLEKPRHSQLTPTLALLSLLTLASVLALSLSPWLWITVLGLNAIVIFRTAPKISKDIDTLKTLGRMLGVADRLATIQLEKHVTALADLRSDTQKRRKLRSEIQWLSLLSIDSIFFSGLTMAANLCFLVKPLAYAHTVKRFGRSRQDWVSTYELIGSIDASIAVSNFLYRTPKHCRPAVTNDALIAFENACHPLLTSPIDNSITLDKRSALITGSNMAGKTTFIKTIATNIAFGHTLGICLASRATIPLSSVMASIRGEQSVESGKSRYFSEVHTIMEFLKSLARGECRVFVIDELFSGTNTIERIAVAKAVLDSLSKGAQILVTTHDVELQQLLLNNFDLFHFKENPAVEGFFDYKLRAGICSERNAIRVLERMGFPQTIVQEALAHADSKIG